jgi:dicarboxylate transporter 10
MVSSPTPLDIARSHSLTYKLPLETGFRRGAYPGLSASILRQLTYSVTRFGVYDVIKARLHSTMEPGEVLPAWKMAMAASIAGGLGGVAGNPADIVLVRMIAEGNKLPKDKLGYTNG